ncbi:HET-domain-containing protein [Aaosphaeria arxii CBS 175.79]|uniref:HET-domain-containing protein n=1 Tax=Aaosphaeria arxii CBS 175.79 TaxID=1450172 RepID=A0A6A5XZ80_9PLEO|nr:HET-domain-containing protein [Aaosphaeria arxii CBS 175.79]KAF2018011.1 HET-domain-containing protein [Aaosphaeria arxii CBS 175.79]
MEHIPYDWRQRFSYEGLPIESDHVRLLTLAPGRADEPISCQLDVVSLKSTPRYETLSYAWGSQERAESILLNKQEFPVTANLFAALLHLRLLDTPLRLWIDAICIDQSNLQERSSQVARMREIYKSSSRVYVWLGECHRAYPTDGGDSCTTSGLSRVDSGLGDDILEQGTWASLDGSYAQYRPDMQKLTPNPFGLIEHFSRDRHMYDLPGFQRPTEGGSSVFDETPFLVMHGFLSESWWTRVWCVQEILLAPEASLMYGSWRIDFDLVKDASIQSRRHVMSCCSETQMRIPAHFWKFRDDDIAERTKTTINAERYQDLDALLRLYAHRKCQDPRDRIYGLLGLPDMKRYPGLVPDYEKSTASVYYDATVAIMQDNPSSLRFLTGTRGTRSHDTPLPSWVRDYSHTQEIATTWAERHRLERYTLYKAADGRPANVMIIERSVLRLRGVRVATIQHVGIVRTTVNLSDSMPAIKSWLQLANLPLPIEVSEIRKPRQRQFWRTLVADAALELDANLDYIWSRTDEALMETYLENIANFLNPNSDNYTACSEFRPSLTKIITMATLQKAFCLTDDGGMALVHPGTQPGDEIWVLEGGNVPFVLRAGTSEDSPTSRYELVGDCYLDECMDGQALRQTTCEMTSIDLE